MSTLRRFSFSLLALCRTNVDFNVDRTNVVVTLTSAAQTSMRTNVDYHLRWCLLSSVAQNSPHQKLLYEQYKGLRSWLLWTDYIIMNL
jgi:hypothetical protein